MRAPSHRLAVAAILAFAGAGVGATVWGFPVPPVPDEIQLQRMSVDTGYGINTFDMMDSDCHVVGLNTVDASGEAQANAVDECD